jgi:hypothetical protein
MNITKHYIKGKRIRIDLTRPRIGEFGLFQLYNTVISILIVKHFILGGGY